ncbi:MAG TPA: hypothetical protein VLM42_12260 [Bryobacteraceae bacterium]|nr:hypothetical protein [Bryobacteraceae bacterium]
MTAASGWLSLCGALSGFLCGCGNLPESYAPPPQRPVFEAPISGVRVLNMADADAETHFVQDISPSLEANTWRWTGKRPAIRMFPGTTQKLNYAIDFAVPGATFTQTGPVTVSFFVNEHLLDRVHYAAPGRQRFEKPVPAEWMDANEYTVLTAEIDKVWIPAERKAKPLGFILVSLGLEQK